MADRNDDDSDLRARFSARIQALRVARGWTVEAAAKLIGISKPYLHKLEYGERDANLDLIGRIAEVYGVDEFDLFIWPGASIRHDVIDLLKSMSEEALQGLKTFVQRMSGAEEQGRKQSRRGA